MIASAGSLLIPSFLNQAVASAKTGNQKRLIVIQLSGGNDGLNTVTPFRNDIYYRERGHLALQKQELITLNDELALNQSLSEIAQLFEKRDITILNNVGYPNPDRSHFRSMDIWQSASGSDQHWNTGWIGRYLDAQCPDPHQAIEIDDSLSLAMKGNHTKGLAVSDPERLIKTTQSKLVQVLVESGDHRDNMKNDNLSYLYKTIIETSQSANYLYEKLDQPKLKRTYDYPQNEFGKKLNLVGNLISHGADSRVFYVELSGFDTHARQKPTQNRLLSNYSKGVKALADHLKASGEWENTTILTFSEFGRRVKSNAANGTDHGTANNVFLMGGSLKQPGIYNEAPDLEHLDNGDLNFSIDFREIYSSILGQWFEINPNSVLSGNYKSLPLFRKI